MPVWGWALLIGCAGLVMVGALAGIVLGTHRLRTHRPLHADPADLGAPLSRETTAEMELKLEPEEEDATASSRVN